MSNRALIEELECTANFIWEGLKFNDEVFRVLLRRAAAALEAQDSLIGWVDSWISNPVSSYSVMALDGLFLLTRDKIAALALSEPPNAEKAPPA